jgi:hypothetical protein
VIAVAAFLVWKGEAMKKMVIALIEDAGSQQVWSLKLGVLIVGPGVLRRDELT